MNVITFPPPADAYCATYKDPNGDINRDLTIIPRFDPARHDRRFETELGADFECPLDAHPLRNRVAVYHGGPHGNKHPTGLVGLIHWQNQRANLGLHTTCPSCNQNLLLWSLTTELPVEAEPLIEQPPVAAQQPPVVAQQPPVAAQQPRAIVHLPQFTPQKALLALGIIAAAGTIFYNDTNPGMPQVEPPRLNSPKPLSQNPRSAFDQYTPEQLLARSMIQIPDTPPKGYCKIITRNPKTKLSGHFRDYLAKVTDAGTIHRSYTRLTLDPDAVLNPDQKNILRNKCTEKEIEKFLYSFKNRASLEFKLIDAAARGRLGAVAAHANQLARKIRKEEIPNARFQGAIHAAAKFGEINIINYLVDRYQISSDILNSCLFDAAFEKDKLAFRTLLDAGASFLSDEYTSDYAHELGLVKYTQPSIFSSIRNSLGF